MSKQDNKTTPKLFNVQDAANHLGVNANTIRRWAYSKQLKGSKIGLRGDWRFTLDDISRMSTSNIVENESDHGIARLQTIHQNLGQIQGSSHFVQFYENDTYLIDAIKKFLTGGDIAIVVATQMHRESLEKVLTSEHINLAAARLNGKYIALDAHEMLASFMDGESPDPTRFFAVIGGLIAEAEKKGHHVRVFGEMVAILWAQGNQVGAIALEELWNELQKIYTFSLFCAYPMQQFAGQSHAARFHDVCTTHTQVLPTEQYTGTDNHDERLRIIASLQQKARSLEEEIEKRKKLEAQKDEFIGIVSHELKTPVTSLKAFAQVLHKRFVKENDMQAAEFLKKMDLQINKLTTLISDLLDVTKIDSGKLQYNETHFSFDSLVDEIIEEVQRTVEKHAIVKVGNVTQDVFADRDRIGQVIINFLTNAVKYSPNAQEVIVNVSNSNNQIQVSVQDFGVGISEHEKEAIFERFYRAPGMEEQTFPGLGLGLYISTQIIKRHSGKIWVQSEKGKGSIFSFSLPIEK